VLKAISDEVSLEFVCTDKGSENIRQRVNQLKIPLFVGNPREGRAIKALGKLKIDVLLSVNYLFLVDQDLIDLAGIAAINFHGSLLPRYRGRTPHVWAIINGEEMSGITAHRIVQECDAGDILLQRSVLIEPDDSGASILAKFKTIYPDMIRDVIGLLQTGASFVSQDHSLASFYGKRMPEDGRISWSWHRFRIRNWVRAQTPPYPGAFSDCDGQRVRIDWVRLSSMGFSGADADGLVLAVMEESFFVKAPDGVLEITRFADPQNVVIEGKILS